ncbi:MAG: UvrB/UvrC motif-containing protein [Spirochaetales bacterium]|nr:UvrB/UvrC motif-containing protein [Spirochaetales bacterium]
MKCEMCGIHEATIHVRQIMGNKAVDVHLCAECASRSGITDQENTVELTVSQLLTGLMDGPIEKGTEPVEGMCSVCGLSLQEFRKKGKAGCPECYQFFRRDIIALLENVAGTPRHRGKLPKKLKTYKVLMVDKQILKQQLKEAVSREDYEAAAALRDRIRSFDGSAEDQE